jgi:replicative DNA helicase
MANVEAEAVVLGAIMIDGKRADFAFDILTEDDFFEPVHGRIFRLCGQLLAQGKDCNPVVLRPFLESDEAIQQLGGVGYLAKLTGNMAVVMAARDMAHQIAELAQRRRLYDAMEIALGELRNPSFDTSVSSIMEAVERETETGRMANDATREGSMASFMQSAKKEWDEPDSRILCRTVPSFDKGVGSLRRGDMCILAGRPGMGKTAAALSIGRGFAENGHATLILSREMRAEDLGERCLCDASYDTPEPIPYAAVTGRKMHMSDRRTSLAIIEKMHKVPLSIIDTPSMKTGELSRRIRRWKRRCIGRGESPDVVIVDYLQLLNPDHKTNGTTEKISEISMALKSMAKEHDIVVMPLSQLSRAVETRENKRPQLSDLRDSGQIEQDADAIVFLYRSAYYLKLSEPQKETAAHLKWQDDLRECETDLEMIFAKVRKGVSGTRVTQFHAQFQAVRG